MGVFLYSVLFRALGRLLLGLSLASSFGSLSAAPPIDATATPVETEATIYPYEFRDGTGRMVRLPQKPVRILSLAPSITEGIYAIGAQDNLLANTRFCDFPEAARALPKIGGIENPDLELLFKLKPQLILATNLTPPEVIHQIEKLGLSIAVFQQNGIAGALADLIQIGKALDVFSTARHIVEEVHRRLAALQAISASLPRPRTLLLYGSDLLFSAGEKTFPGQIIAFSGGANIAAHRGADWPQLSVESILTSDPEVILLAVDNDSQSAAQKALERWQKDTLWKNIAAVRNKRIFAVPNALLSIPGPRMAEAAELIARFLHPGSPNQ